jgi:Transglutaminase-like superfamily
MSIPEGSSGVHFTLQVMSRLTKEGKKHPLIRGKATELTQSLPQKDKAGEIAALFYFVRDNIRYVRDIHDVETLHFADQVLLQEYGDCDDKSVLLASLLESIGHPTRFVAVGFETGRYSHVLVDTLVGRDKWLPLDSTEPRPIGWRPPGIVETMVVHN